MLAVTRVGTERAAPRRARELGYLGCTSRRGKGERVAGISAFDIASCILILATMACGFARGSLRQGADLLALYVGLAVSAQYAPLATQAVRPQLSGTPIYVLGAIVFFAILLFVGGVLAVVAHALLQPSKPRALSELDQVGGAILGLICAAAFIAVSVPVLRYSAAASWGSWDTARDVLLRALERSYLLPVFEKMTQYVLLSIQPLLPAGIPEPLLGTLIQA